MKGKRLPMLLVSGIVSLAIVVAGTYFGFASFWTGDDATHHESAEHGEVANPIISTSAYLGQPDDFSNLLGKSDVVVEGVISQLYASRWSTDDGAVPADLDSDHVRDMSVHIRTPVELSVKRVFKGDAVGDTIKFSFVGGQVGDVVQAFEWNEVFERDLRIVVFLSEAADGEPAKNVEPSAYFPRMHLIVVGDEARGPTKTIKMTDLVDQLQ